MTIRSAGGMQLRRADRYQAKRGYGRRRTEYDARRRARTKTPLDAQYWDICKRDPCAYCGHPARENRTAVNDVDHIVNLDAGGADEWHNYTGACPACNRGRKRNRTMLECLLALGEE